MKPIRLFLGIGLALLVTTAARAATYESQDFLLDNPTFTGGSVNASTGDYVLDGTLGVGGTAAASTTDIQAGTVRAGVLPTPPAPVVTAVDSTTVTATVSPGINDPYTLLELKVQEAGAATATYYNSAGNLVAEADAWTTAHSWPAGLRITGLQAGKDYTFQSRARLNATTTSAFSAATTVTMPTVTSPANTPVVSNTVIPEAPVIPEPTVQPTVQPTALPPVLTTPIGIFSTETLNAWQAWFATPVGQVVANIGRSLLAPVAAAAALAQVAALGGTLPGAATAASSWQVFALFRRRRSWGMILDQNKKPVVGAKITLKDATANKVVAQQVTDHQGRYMFVVNERGHYLLTVEATDMVSVTKLVHGSVNLTVVMGAVLEHNPIALRRQQLASRVNHILDAWRIPLLIIGSIFCFVVFVSEGGALPLWLGGYYVLAWLLEFYIQAQPSPQGKVVDERTRTALADVVVRLYRNKVLVQTLVTDRRGRFSTIVRPGNYRFEFSRLGFDTVVKDHVVLTTWKGSDVPAVQLHRLQPQGSQ